MSTSQAMIRSLACSFHVLRWCAMNHKKLGWSASELSMEPSVFLSLQAGMKYTEQ